MTVSTADKNNADSFHSDASEKSEKRLKEVVRKEGWNVPLASNSSMSVLQAKTELVSGLSVDVKQIQTDAGKVVPIESFYLSEDGKLIVVSRDYTVQSAYSYEIRGKKLAYKIFASPVLFKNGRRVPTRAVVDFYFNDEDGDGVFETRYTERAEIKIPDWAAKQQ